MAALPISGLETAVIALMALLAAVAVDSVLRGDSGRERVGDKAKSAARAVPIPRESVDRCPPERGRLVTRRWHMSDVSRNYQARVTGFAPKTEWLYQKVEFDGFRAAECRLLEAKARYDQFFYKKTGKPKPFFESVGVQRVINQARRHLLVVKTNPPTRLTWYFMQPISHRYFADVFAEEGLPVESLFHP